MISAHPKVERLTYIGQSPSHHSTWTLDLVLKFLRQVAWKHAPLPSSTPKLLLHPQRKYIHRYTCYACMSRYFLFVAGLHVVTRKSTGRSDRHRVAPAQRPTVSYIPVRRILEGRPQLSKRIIGCDCIEQLSLLCLGDICAMDDMIGDYNLYHS